MLSSVRLFQASQNQLDHNRLLALINSLEDGFLAVDNENKVVLCNGAALALLDINEVQGKKLSEVLSVVGRDGAVVDLITVAAASGSSFSSNDYSLKRPDGSHLAVHVKISAVKPAYKDTRSSGYVILLRQPVVN
ncbi:MAG TPA: PAS domain-containing protein [Candidatus Saccharimonadales bacterium]|nr:PAS domain-containing protein [Candidatus Saccharimonadales bacterium]